MLIGLLGAALGVDRADETAQASLAQSYYFAIQIFSAGRPFTDYHTAQMPSRDKKIRYATRREELADKSVLNTVLTSRDYRTDFLAGLAVSAAPTAPYALETLQSALSKPHYTLSFGRKSCVFGLPFAPLVADYAGPREALHSLWSKRNETRPSAAVFQQLRAKQDEIIMDAALAPADEPKTIEFVRDQPISRKRWQFGLRDVAILNAERPSS
jgi:CRISPR system Cascade subunit CasD